MNEEKYEKDFSKPDAPTHNLGETAQPSGPSPDDLESKKPSAHIHERETANQPAEAPHATRAREWAEKLKTHWKAIEESQFLFGDPEREIKIAFAKKNLMVETLRELEMRLTVANHFVKDRMGGMNCDAEQDQIAAMRKQAEELKAQIPDPRGHLNDFVRRHQGQGYVSDYEGRLRMNPEPPPDTPEMSTMDNLKGIHATITLLEEELGSVLLAEAAGQQEEQNRVMSESGEMAYSAYQRLGGLLKRLDL